MQFDAEIEIEIEINSALLLPRNLSVTPGIDAVEQMFMFSTPKEHRV